MILTPEVQATVDGMGAQSQAPLAVLSGGMPTAAQPDANPINAAPDAVRSAPAPGSGTSFGEKIAKAASQIGIPTKPDGTPQPMGWARSLVGATQHVLSGLGDSAAIGTVPAGGGALTGISRTLAARNERMQAEQDRTAKTAQQQKENERQDKLVNSEVEERKALTAHTNAQMIHEQALTHQVGEEAIGKSIEAGKAAVNNLTTGESKAPVIGQDLTSDELQARIAQGKMDPTKQVAYPTGRKQIGEDANGVPQFRTTYTVLGESPNVTVDEQMAAQISKYSGTEVKPDQVLTGAQYNWLAQQSANNQAATAARDKTLADAKLSKAAQDQKLETVDIGSDWNNALAQAKNDPFKAVAAMQANPAMRQKYPHLYNDVREAYGAKAWDELTVEKEKEAVKLREKAREEGGPGSNLAGDQFLRSLSLGRRNEIQGIVNGQIELNSGRLLTKDGQALLRDILQYDPTFDASKAPSYFKTRTEFTSGKTAQGINSLNTAFQHLGSMYDNQTFGSTGVTGALAKAGQHIGIDSGAAARARALEVDKQLVSSEVGKAVTNGVLTEGEKNEILKTLDNSTATGGHQAVVEAMKRIHEKIENYQQQFDDSRPSQRVGTKQLLNPASQAVYDKYVSQGGQSQPTQPTQQQPTNQQPVTQSIRHQVGDSIIQNGRTFKVTSVDATGRVTGAQ